MKEKLILISALAIMLTGCSASDSSKTQSKADSQAESSSAVSTTEESSAPEESSADSSKAEETVASDILDPYELEKQYTAAEGDDIGDIVDWQDFGSIDEMRQSAWGKFYAEKTGLDIAQFIPDTSQTPDIEEGGCRARLSFCSRGYKFGGKWFTLEADVTKYDDIQALFDAFYGEGGKAALKGGKAAIDGDIIVDEFKEYDNGYLIMGLSKNGFGLSVYTSDKSVTLDEMKEFLRAIAA